MFRTFAQYISTIIPQIYCATFSKRPEISCRLIPISQVFYAPKLTCTAFSTE